MDDLQTGKTQVMSKKNTTNTVPAIDPHDAPETKPESQGPDTAPESTGPDVDPNDAPETKPESQEPDTAPESAGPDVDPHDAPETPDSDKTPGTKAAKGGKATDALPNFLTPYRKAYPTCRAFHVTSDRMVFLEADLGLARVHQNNLGGVGEVKTYKVK